MQGIESISLNQEGISAAKKASHVYFVFCFYSSGHEFEQTSLGDTAGRGRLACCSLWGHNESDTTTEQQR